MTSSRIIVGTSLFLSTFFVSHLGAQPSPLSSTHRDAPSVVDPTTEAAIRDSLGHLKKEYEGTVGVRSGKLDDPLLPQLGFDSVEQLDRVVVGEEFTLYEIGPDQLRQYMNSRPPDPLPLLVKSPASIYPLLDPRHPIQKVRSSITIISKGNSRREAGIGDAPLIRLLTEARIEARQKGLCLEAPTSNCFVVSVKALGLHLFGARDVRTNALYFVRVNDVRGHVRPTDLRPASDVLVELWTEVNKLRPIDSSHKPKPEKKFKGFKQPNP